MARFTALRWPPIPPRDAVWHYTSAAGGYGILSSATFRATHVRHMNDSEEMQTFLDHAIEELKWAKRRPEYAVFEPCFDHAILQVQQWEESRYFVVSFSTEPDALSQWRGYGGTGQSMALGFSREALANIGPGWRFGQCIYSPARARALARRIIRRGLLEVMRGDFDRVEFSQRLDWAIRRKLQELAPLCKHEAFAEEREWRLIGTPLDNGDIKFKVSRFGISPYYEVGLPRMPSGEVDTLEVVIGPGATREGYHGLQTFMLMD